ncbi:MAG: L-2-amino-thiazoline-4-carboxylic acid hydrolase [Candidatus Hodarchaeota archaeon]
MNQEYEYYGTYDENATGEINLEKQIRDWLWTMELMFEHIERTKPEILETFLKNVEGKYTTELEGTSFVLADSGFDKVANDHTLLGSYPRFKDLSLRIIMKYIPLKEGYILSEEAGPIKYVDYLRAKHMLLYHRITALVETLGREAGIEFFENFVQFWGKEFAKEVENTDTIEFARENYVKFWRESNAFEFGVVDVYEAAFLAKFDRCAWYESMKHIEDQELAYYAVCYPGPRLGSHIHQNISMRRSVTLFTGEFCDELRWDRHVHDEPEQPSHEFSRKLVPK